MHSVDGLTGRIEIHVYSLVMALVLLYLRYVPLLLLHYTAYYHVEYVVVTTLHYTA
jgi:hypothetical protein